jgi:uncharacterized delta-60 repeat protein
VIIATRLNANGQPDATFGNRGLVAIPIGGTAEVDSGDGLALQSDGKIVIAGTGTASGQLQFAAIRLDQNGSLDQSFGQGGIAMVAIGQDAIANGVVIDTAGNIDLSGTAQIAGTNHFAAARLTPAGQLDHTFGSGGVTVLAPTAAAWGMGEQADGSLVIAGQQLYNGTMAYIVARLTPSGAPDAGFGKGGIVTLPIGQTAVAYAMAITPGGQIVVSGNATSSSGSWIVPTVELNPDGSLNRSFGQGGIEQLSGQGVNALTLDPHGHILLAGCGASLVRLNADGSPDLTFNDGRGYAVYTDGASSAANGVALQPPNGKIILAGTADINGALQVLVMRLIG